MYTPDDRKIISYQMTVYESVTIRDIISGEKPPYDVWN